MTRVRCILVETTVPVRIRPRIETRPVKGHFLSVFEIRSVCSHTFAASVTVQRELSPLDCCFCAASSFSQLSFDGEFRTDVVSLDRILWRPEAQAHIFVPSPATLADSLALRALVLGVLEDVRLLLERALRLDCQLGRHVCGWLSTLIAAGSGCLVERRSRKRSSSA